MMIFQRLSLLTLLLFLFAGSVFSGVEPVRFHPVAGTDSRTDPTPSRPPSPQHPSAGPSRVPDGGREGPSSPRYRGWVSGSVDPEALALDERREEGFRDRVTARFGSDPFVISTVAGEVKVHEGIAPDLLAELDREKGETVCIVLPSVPGCPEMEVHLRKKGARILRAVTPHGYAVKAGPDVLRELAGDPLVYAVARCPWTLKIDPRAAARWGIPGVRRALEIEEYEFQEDWAHIQIHDPQDRISVERALVSLGLGIEKFHEGISLFVVRGMTADRAVSAARISGVSFLEPRCLPKTLLNSSVAACNHAIVRDGYDYDDNNAVITGCIDSGFQISHSAFATQSGWTGVHALGWNVSGEAGSPFLDNSIGHGTHVLGILLSRWQFAGGGLDLRGMAPREGNDPGVEFRFVRCGRTSSSSLYNVDDAMNTLAEDNGAMIFNNSWGLTLNTGTNAESVLADHWAWNRNQVFVFAGGNSGPGSGTINSPAAAKNVIGAGHLHDPDLAVESDTSQGPTADGRRKPDIYAPGRTITSAYASDPGGWTNKGGSSMAAPHVTGFLDTLLGHHGSFQRRPALVKAHLIANAVPGTGLQSHSGSLDSLSAHWSLGSPPGPWTVILWDFYEGDPRGVEYISWDFQVPAGTTRAKFVLSWIEPACPVGAARATYNDVDLYVDVHGDSPDAFGEYSSTSPVDNVEVVTIPSPEPGLYRARARRVSSPQSYRLGIAVRLDGAGDMSTSTWTHTPAGTPSSTPTASLTPSPPETQTPVAETDLDGDSILDLVEGPNAPGSGLSNRYLPDTDGDGLRDGDEDLNRDGHYPARNLPGTFTPASETHPLFRDTDGDDYLDSVERLYTLSDPNNPADPSPPYIDADSDELPAGVDPDDEEKDYDGDRYLDGYERVTVHSENNSLYWPPIGDVNNTGNVDNADSQLLLNFFGNLLLPETDTRWGDLDRNRVIDNGDSQAALVFFANIQPVLPMN